MVFDPGTGMVVGQIAGQLTAQFTAHLLRRTAEERDFKFREEDRAEGKRRFQESLAAARENLILQIESNREAGEIDHMLRHWPLQQSPLNILRASRRLQRKSLNIFLCLIHGNDQPIQSHARDPILDTINDIADLPIRVAERTAFKFDNDVFIYPEILKNSSLRGDSLRTALAGLLWTEPTIVIELRVPDVDTVEIQIGQWNGPSTFNDLEDSFTSRTLFTRFPPYRIRIPPKPLISSSDESDRAKNALALQQATRDRKIMVAQVLAQMIVAAGDIFRATQIPDASFDPLFPSVMQNPTLGIYQLALRYSDENVEQAWHQLIERYIAMYKQLALTDPNGASEKAARAAIKCYELDHGALAERLLHVARELHPAHSNILSDEEFLGVLNRFRPSGNIQRPNAGALSELERAMAMIRSIKPKEPSERRSLAHLSKHVPSSVRDRTTE